MVFVEQREGKLPLGGAGHGQYVYSMWGGKQSCQIVMHNFLIVYLGSAMDKSQCRNTVYNEAKWKQICDSKHQRSRIGVQSKLATAAGREAEERKTVGERYENVCEECGMDRPQQKHELIFARRVPKLRMHRMLIDSKHRKGDVHLTEFVSFE
jgi:hypothetical protein